MPYKDPIKQKAAKEKSYRKTQQAIKRRDKEKRNRIRKFLWDYKIEKKCKICKFGHPAALEFHHRDPKLKEIRPSRMINNKWSMERISQELKKCDVLCSNCHRIYHFKNDGIAISEFN